MNDSDEIATLYACYRSGALSRRELLEGIAGITGAAAAAAMLTTLETHGPEVEPNLALAACIAEMSDRLEIQGNVWDFSNAIDLQAWDMLDHVFTLDAEMAYGGVFLKGPRIKDWLRGGSDTVILNKSATRMPGNPTIIRAPCQPTFCASQPPSSRPRAAPSGMARAQIAMARDRSETE
jgi:hypothetical protein